MQAYLEASASLTDEERRVETGLLAALAAEPERLAPVRDRYAAWQSRVESEAADPVAGTIVRLAADGLWIADLLGLAPLEDELRAQVMRRLRELAAGR